MKIIKPSVEFFGAVPTDYENALKFIERCGRLCYKSEDKITATSAKGFVRRLINSGHFAMPEHSNFVVRCATEDFATLKLPHGTYLKTAYTNGHTHVGGNLTAWMNYFQASYAGLCYPFYSVWGDLFSMPFLQEGIWEVCPHNEISDELHRYAAKFICDRGVTHELVRHRPCSFGQESTRYVNYMKREMEFIEPAGFENWSVAAKEFFANHCKLSEIFYGALLNEKLKPQQARAVLPNALKTEIVVTADAAEWAHIRKLRTAKDAQPDMQRVMGMIPWEAFLP